MFQDWRWGNSKIETYGKLSVLDGKMRRGGEDLEGGGENLRKGGYLQFAGERGPEAAGRLLSREGV